MKKQIDSAIKAHLPWSALMIRRGRAFFLCSKYSPLRLKAFHREVMQRPGLPLIRLIAFGGAAVGLAALIATGESTAQSTSSPALLQPTAATHETRADSQELIGLRKVNEDPHLQAWGRNRFSDLVGFKIDHAGRLVGEAWVPLAGLDGEEWSLYVNAVARACDRVEYLLSGGDEL